MTRALLPKMNREMGAIEDKDDLGVVKDEQGLVVNFGDFSDFFLRI